MNRFIRLRTFALALAVASAAMTVCAGVSQAATSSPQDSDVSSITIRQDTSKALTSTLTVKFAKPITSSEAEQVKKRLSASSGARPNATVDHLTCFQDLRENDANGSFYAYYNCMPSYAALNWSFQLSPADQATVAGGLYESGILWFRNGARQPLGAPHAEGANYIFHGTMQPVYNGDTVDYQDNFSWGSSVYPGSTEYLTVAGEVGLG